jgi:hypothetical protein
MVVVGFGSALAASQASALDTLPACDTIKDANDRLACMQTHITHLEQTILGLGAQIADLTNQLRVKSEMETSYKLLFSQTGKCLGQEDQKPAFVACTEPDAFDFLDRTKTGLPKKAEQQQPAPVTPDNPKKNKKKNKTGDAAQSGNAPAASGAAPQGSNAPAAASSAATKPPKLPADNSPGQAVPKTSP